MALPDAPRDACSIGTDSGTITVWSWPGGPRVNIQKSKGGKAKPYQVRQVLKAIDKLGEEQK
jgi:hypothetical protein